MKTTPVHSNNFERVKVGDVVLRLLAGSIPQKLKVIEVTDTLIITGGGWRFDRKTGVEEDEDLGWGVKHGVTGSYLKEVCDEEIRSDHADGHRDEQG